MLDDLGNALDPLAEVGELASDLGLIDRDDLDAATAFIQQLLAERGVPNPTYRFLHGPPDWDKKESSGMDPEDWITQAGHMVDNLGLTPGHGKLGAAIINRELDMEEEVERPGWIVRDLQCEEGLNQLFRCELLLERPEFPIVDPDTGDPMGQLIDDLDWDRVRDGTFGVTDVIQDANDFQDGVDQVTDMYNNPNNYTAMWSDKTDPDSLDPAKIPAGPTPVDPNAFLGQFCRVCIARRFRADKLTLNERWFTGIATEFEDLGYVRPRVRQIRVVIQPRLWLLSQRRAHRVFQDLNAVEIVVKLLEEHGIYGEGDRTGELLPRPGGKKLLGPLGVPDAADAAMSKIGALIPGDVGDDIGGLLSEDVEGWCPKREQCVQYGESDLEFALRLLAEEGVTFFFECAERREVLVLADDPLLSGRKALPVDRRPLAVGVGRPAPNVIARSEVAWNAGVDRQLVPSTVSLRDDHLSTPSFPTEIRAGEQPLALPGIESPAGLAAQAMSLGSELAGNDASGPLDDATGEEDYAGPEAHWFEYPGDLVFVPSSEGHLPFDADYDAYDGPELAQYSLEGFRSRGAGLRFQSDCTMLTPGHNLNLGGGAFDVLHKKTGTIDGSNRVVANPEKFLITSVLHRTGDSGYENAMTGISHSLRFRPERLPKPRIPGVQTATVVDVDFRADAAEAKDDVHADELWRVLVRFHWDRRDPAAAQADARPHSAWVRVTEPLAGGGMGTVMAPRPGMEVVLSFVHGDPDRPVIVGCLYSSAEGPESTFPRRGGKSPTIDHEASKIQSTWMSRSWPQKKAAAQTEPRGNVLRFDDNGKHEEIFLFAQKDLIEKVGHDHLTTVQKNQTNRVKNDHLEEVGEDQKLEVTRESGGDDDWSRQKIVGDREEVKIGTEGGTAKLDVEIARNETIRVVGDRIQKVADTETVVVEGKELEPKTDEEKEKGAIARDLHVVGDQTVDIGEDDILKVSGDRRELVAGSFDVKAAKIDMTVRGKGGDGEDAEGEEKSGIQVDEEGVSLHSNGSITIAAGEDLLIRSENDRIYVRAETGLVLQRGDDRIVLAADGTAELHASDGLRIGTDASFIELRPDHILLNGDGSDWKMEASAPTMSTLTAPTVTLHFEGETHLNAGDVKVQKA